MNKIVFATLMVAAFAAPAFAEEAKTPAVADEQTNPAAPVAGANSFTEDQARARVADAGYTDVSALVKDSEGIWRGKASKGGAMMDVAVDFQGNVTSK
ncbi:PepSY domain-containing protein [Kaistia terrae]|uniref:PepSY domain-containing protein n=1 Tax=Kaistia terrae TaxID=537017 RepID=A0ABW0PZK4_9HYPH|nr:PepSY domain-containing protein [Kaistia terrae]MCX5580496.1 PepSY domain-containing protein [Kaistia terrae]